MPQLRRVQYPVAKLPSFRWLIYPALALAILLVFWPVLHFDFVNYDDPDYTTANPHIRPGLSGAGIAWAFTASYQANWIPLTWISHMADRQFFGWDAGADHAVNLALHILAALLLFAALKRMTRMPWPSALVAFAFGVHPLHIESVAWIAERKDVLCAVFFFATIYLYAAWVERPGAARYAAVAIAYACALLSKPMAVTLPLLLLVLDGWPLRRLTRATLARRAIEKIPLLGLAAAASIVTFAVQRGAGAVIEGIPLGLRMENALVAYAMYIWKFVWPDGLAVFYPYPAGIEWWQWMGAALLLAGITTYAIVRRRKRPYLLAGWLWFAGTLVPVIGLVQAGAQARADRYTYIPLVGLAILFFFAGADFANRANWRRPPAALLAMLLAVAWMAAARADVGYWQDSSTLFQRAIAVTKDNYVAYANLASFERQRGANDDAAQNFRHALEIKPHFADAENGLGETLSAEGRFDDALPHLTEAVRLEPNSLSARINLGAAYSRKGMAHDAETQYRAALAIDAQSPEAQCGLGIALDELGRRQEALPHLTEAVHLNLDYGDGHYNLGRILALSGRTDEAIGEFREAIRLDPNSEQAHYNLGVALGERGRIQEASEEFEKAADIQPDDMNARFNYASAQAELGAYNEAIVQFEGILRMHPDFKAARESLARAIAARDAKSNDAAAKRKPN